VTRQVCSQRSLRASQLDMLVPVASEHCRCLEWIQHWWVKTYRGRLMHGPLESLLNLDVHALCNSYSLLVDIAYQGRRNRRSSVSVCSPNFGVLDQCSLRNLSTWQWQADGDTDVWAYLNYRWMEASHQHWFFLLCHNFSKTCRLLRRHCGCAI